MSTPTEPTKQPAAHQSPADEAKAVLTAPWFVHDLLLYLGSYLTLWLADTPAGGGWDAAISVAPVALSAVVRQILGKTE